MKKISAKEATRLARNYPLSVRWSDEDQGFVGSIPGLIGECCHGDTPEEVIPQIKDTAEDLVTYSTQPFQHMTCSQTRLYPASDFGMKNQEISRLTARNRLPSLRPPSRTPGARSHFITST